jgi:hypothetical protein
VYPTNYAIIDLEWQFPSTTIGCLATDARESHKVEPSWGNLIGRGGRTIALARPDDRLGFVSKEAGAVLDDSLRRRAVRLGRGPRVWGRAPKWTGVTCSRACQCNCADEDRGHRMSCHGRVPWSSSQCAFRVERRRASGGPLRSRTLSAGVQRSAALPPNVLRVRFE